MWVQHQYHVIIIYVTMVLSLVFNSILIFFIYKHSVAEFGTYRTLLFVTAGFNIMYSVTVAVVMPVIHVYELSFFLFTTGLGSIPKCVSRLLASIFCSLFAQSLYLLALQFVYRYVQVVRPNARFLFGKGSYILIALYAFTAVDYGALDGEVQWLDVSGLLNVSVVIGFTFALIPFCGIATYRSLYRHDATSETTKRRQRQMFRLLLIQSFFPLTFTFVPSAAILVMSLFGRHIGSGGNIVGILLTVYPVIEPAVILYFVSSYRKAIRRYLGMVNRAPHPKSSVAKF